jgi:hypothetical protein
MLATGCAGCTLAVFSGAFELFGIVAGAAGAAAGLGCVLPAAGGSDAPDLLLDFAALGAGAEVLVAEFTALAFVGAVRVFAITPAGCTIERVGAAVVVFFTCTAAGLVEGSGCCALAEVPLATDTVSAVGEFADGRGSSEVDKTISRGAFSAGGATVCGGFATATGCTATLLATGAAAGIKFDATLAGADAEAAIRACARDAACASAEAPAVDLVLSSSNGGKFGKVLSGTYPSTPLAE